MERSTRPGRASTSVAAARRLLHDYDLLWLLGLLARRLRVLRLPLILTECALQLLMVLFVLLALRLVGRAPRRAQLRLRMALVMIVAVEVAGRQQTQARSRVGRQALGLLRQAIVLMYELDR